VVKDRPFRRGEVWLCALDPTVGSEIRKARPCLIVSPDDMNKALRTVTVLAMTSKGRPAGFRKPVLFNGTNGLILADQMRSIDHMRLKKRLGTVDAETLVSALAILREMFEE
jgi:mRNA interferase MazF